MFCQKCGNEIKEEQTFCRICGDQVSNTKISLQKMDWVNRASSFSLGVIVGLGFILSIFFLFYKLAVSDGLAILVLFIMFLLLSGVINVLLKELNKTKGKLEKDSAEKEIKSLPEQRKQIKEKSFITASWSVTDTTTENLLSSKKRITGEL
ncbi:MAG TPA: zinc ribbon domain-containing protein [Pyrinomonadaceae bacterium]|nr:zinc ribbon domain-containing protein [Pyrinomonadaceae bacterium]